MPSSHSALVTGISYATGLFVGFDQPIFALSVALAMVVVYDATGIRRQAGKHASLINAMIQTILKEGLEDKGFIEERTGGMEELRKNQAKVEPGVKVGVERAARAFAQAKKAMILIGSGQRAIAIVSSNLALITGHMGKE